MRGLIALVARDEGSVLIVVALGLAAILGASILAVDSGSLWVARRTLVTATDAAALAAAHAFAHGADGCGHPQVASLIEANAPGAVFSCVPNESPGSGWVEIAGRTPAVTLAFSRAIGVGGPAVTATSLSMWGPVDAARGVRPIGFCSDNAEVRAGLDALAGGAESTATFRLYLSADEGCSLGRNWTLVAFDGSGATDDIAAWLRGGYPGVVGIDDCNGDTEFGDACPESSATPHDVRSGIRMLADADDPVLVPIVASDGAGGLRIESFVGARVVDVHLDEGESEQFLDLSFERLVVDGSCCAGALTAGAGVFGVRLCGGDHDPVPSEVRCAPDTP